MGYIDNNTASTSAKAGDIAIHWLSISGNKGDESRALSLLSKHFGDRYLACRPSGFYETAIRWPNGARLEIGHNVNGGYLVNLSGGVCDQVTGPDLWSIGQTLLMGGSCTRLDIRCDLHGNGLDLIDQAIASCKRGELCRARKYKAHNGCDAVTQQPYEHAVNLGKRCQGDSRWVRFYDKGLESGERPKGEWLRYEAELSQGHAHAAALQVFGAAGYENGMREAMSILLGVVEFRVVNGSRHLRRRPLAQWWANFIGTIQAVRPRIKPEPSNLQSKLAWYRKQVGPSLQALAQEAGLTISEVAERLMGDVRPSENALHDAAIYQLAALLTEGTWAPPAA